MLSRVKEAKRKFDEKAIDLLHSNGHTIENGMNIFLDFCESNEIMVTITSSLKENANISIMKWFDEFSRSGGSMIESGRFLLPTNDDDRLALLYQLLLKIRSNEINYHGLCLHAFGATNSNQMAFRFHEAISRPLIRGLRHKIEEKEQEVSERPRPELTKSLPTFSDRVLDAHSHDPPKGELDEKFMRVAVELSKKSKPEDDRPHPNVGAVVVKDGRVLDQAFRGEFARGDHAEYTLLERKLGKTDLTGTTLYTTLEPCTARGHEKMPCADRVIQRRIDRVVIGMLDPNPSIQGKGMYKLDEAGVKVQLAELLTREIKELNEDFIAAQKDRKSGSIPSPLQAPVTLPSEAAAASSPVLAPYPPPFAPPVRPRALWGYLLSMIAGILIVVNAAALLSTSFYTLWVEVFFWIPVVDPSATHSLIFIIGAIMGLILVVGSILMLLGYGTISGILVLLLAVLSLVIGGGFVAGFVLGVLGGILGMLGR